LLFAVVVYKPGKVRRTLAYFINDYSNDIRSSLFSIIIRHYHGPAARCALVYISYYSNTLSPIGRYRSPGETGWEKGDCHQAA